MEKRGASPPSILVSFIQYGGKMINIYLTTDPELGKSINPDITVEAEYGTTVVEGSIYTAAHHQPLGTKYGQQRPAPCNDSNIPALVAEMPNDENVAGGTILISHIDLDTLGGVARAMGLGNMFKPEYESFWNLAEFVDNNGVHKLMTQNPSDENVKRLNAWWNIQSKTTRFAFGELHEVTEYVYELLDSLYNCLEMNDKEIQDGIEFKAKTDELNRASFVKAEAGVILRKADSFVNHLYEIPESPSIGECIVAYNTKFNSITASLANDREFDMGDVMREFFNDPEAGGKKGIGGGNRNVQYTFEQAENLAEYMIKKLK